MEVFGLINCMMYTEEIIFDELNESRLTHIDCSFQTMDDYLNVLYHPEHFKGPILFSFRSKAFFGKKKAMIRVEDGEWSDKFSIDVAGSEGVVACKYNGMTYQVLTLFIIFIT